MSRPPRRPLGVGAAASIALHALALVAVAMFIHGAPPKPPQRIILTLDLVPPAPEAPALMKAPQPAPRAVTSPPKLLPLPRPHAVPVTSRPLAPRPPTAPTPPSAEPVPAMQPPTQAAAPVPTDAPAPIAQNPGVVGHRVDAAYKARLEKAIGEQLQYPRAAARRGREGVALVQVRMQRDGRIDGVVLIKSSGVAALDDEAQRVFRRMGRLPPLPADFLPQAAEFEFEVPIAFRLLEGGAR
ncbi:MAG TPA: TonB family protein [Nevskiaceae bacterium]